MTKAKRGKPMIGAEKTVVKAVTIVPADLEKLLAINPNLSKAIRQLINERKETTHHG